MSQLADGRLSFTLNLALASPDWNEPCYLSRKSLHDILSFIHLPSKKPLQLQKGIDAPIVINTHKLMSKSEVGGMKSQSKGGSNAGIVLVVLGILLSVVGAVIVFARSLFGADGYLIYWRYGGLGIILLILGIVMLIIGFVLIAVFSRPYPQQPMRPIYPQQYPQSHYPAPAQQMQDQRFCMNCGQQLIFIAPEQRWYCDWCKMYASSAGETQRTSGVYQRQYR
jgi:ribosomal protein S27AE